MSYNAPPEDILWALGQVVRARRIELQLSQEELAFRGQLHRTYISAIEGGRHSIGLRNLVRLADALELELLDLLQRVVGTATPRTDQEP